MKYRLLPIFFLCTACVHAPISGGSFSDPSIKYDVLCEDKSVKNKVIFFLDTSVEYKRFDNISVTGSDHHLAKVKQKDCLLERNDKMQVDFDILDGVRLFESSCKIGEISFTGRNLQKVEETHNYMFVRRLDGKVWALPKEKCAIKEQEESL